MADIDVIFANQILNEVVNGFRVPDFERTLGMSHDEAAELLARGNSAARRRRSDSEAVSLSETEALFFRNALVATLTELGEDEFETRTGYSLDEGQKRLAGLRE